MFTTSSYRHHLILKKKWLTELKMPMVATVPPTMAKICLARSQNSGSCFLQTMLMGSISVMNMAFWVGSLLKVQPDRMEYRQFSTAFFVPSAYITTGMIFRWLKKFSFSPLLQKSCKIFLLFTSPYSYFMQFSMFLDLCAMGKSKVPLPRPKLSESRRQLSRVWEMRCDQTYQMRLPCPLAPIRMVPGVLGRGIVPVALHRLFSTKCLFIFSFSMFLSSLLLYSQPVSSPSFTWYILTLFSSPCSMYSSSSLNSMASASQGRWQKRISICMGKNQESSFWTDRKVKYFYWQKS